MKRTFTYVLLLALLGGASLWAYNNMLDNSDYFTPNEKWGKRESQDGIGTLETYARSVADVDYPGESWLGDLFRVFRIQHEAYAEVRTFPGASEGEYSLFAEAVRSPKRRTNRRWRGITYEKLKDTYNEGLSRDEALNMNRAKLRVKLGYNEAKGTISKDSGSPSQTLYRSIAKVN